MYNDSICNNFMCIRYSLINLYNTSLHKSLVNFKYVKKKNNTELAIKPNPMNKHAP